MPANKHFNSLSLVKFNLDVSRLIIASSSSFNCVCQCLVEDEKNMHLGRISHTHKTTNQHLMLFSYFQLFCEASKKFGSPKKICSHIILGKKFKNRGLCKNVSRFELCKCSLQQIGDKRGMFLKVVNSDRSNLKNVILKKTCKSI